MKMITPAALLRCLVEGKDEVHVDPDVAERARKSVQRMIEIGTPAAASEWSPDPGATASCGRRAPTWSSSAAASPG